MKQPDIYDGYPQHVWDVIKDGRRVYCNEIELTLQEADELRAWLDRAIAYGLFKKRERKRKLHERKAQ